MKKSWIIALSVVGVVIVTIIILCFTLFTVQNVNVQFWTSTQHEYEDEKIISASNIQMGKNIFFLDKQNFADNIEHEYPYLQVINIETSFPSSLTIHVRERQSFYAIKNDEGYLILDDYLKVLEQSQELTKPAIFVESKIETLDGSEKYITDAQGNAGDFLQIDLLKEFYDALLVNGLTRSDCLAMIKQITFFESENEVFGNTELGLKLTLYSGREVYLHNANVILEYKLAKFFAVEKALPSLAPDLSDEVINQSEIHINNFIGSDYPDEDCYFYLVYEGERVTL